MLPQTLCHFLLRTDAILRGPSVARDPAIGEWRRGLLSRLLLATLLFGAVYGATMGTFGGFAAERWWQILYSACKVPMLLLVGFCLSLPSFFVLNTVLGVRSDFAEVLAALFSTQAGLAIVLASLSPVTAFWYLSDGDYDAALTFNAFVFGISTVAAQSILRRSYRPLIARNPRHRLLLVVWLTLYSFITIPMAWVLRPFVGSPSAPVGFLRREAWGNAYIELLRIALHALRH